MKIELYSDGIAFCSDDDYEIAFYSNITDRITYPQKNGYKDYKIIGCSSIPYADNLMIVEEVRRYKRSLECEVLNE